MMMTMCGSAPVSPPASGRVIRLPPSRGKAKGRNTNYHDNHDHHQHHHGHHYHDHDNDCEMIVEIFLKILTTET